jgi:hypothetical protein
MTFRTFLAPPGSLLKSNQPKKPAKGKVAKALGRDPRDFDKEHLEALRQCPCLSCGADPCGQAAHVRMTAPGKPNPGMQKKPHDQDAVPLCQACHLDDQHSGSETVFWKKLGLDPQRICAALRVVSPNVEFMRQVIMTAHVISKIGKGTA